MTRLALLTALALSASSFAYADPPYDRDRFGDRDRDRRGDRTDQRDGRFDRERYDRYDRSRWSRDFRGRWLPLAENYSARNKAQQIILRGQNGRFRRIRIEAVRGAPVITQITVQYEDDSSQIVQLNERLMRGAGEVISLNNNQPIRRIIVYTDPRVRGAYSIYGA